MAAVSPPADQATELLQKLSLDAPAKTHDTTQEGTKKPSTAQFGSVNSGEAPSVLNPTFDRSLTPILPDFIDPNMYAYTPATYYYGSYDGSLGEWDDYRYLNQDGVEMSAGVYGDIYQHGYGYAPYGAYTSPASPVPTLGHDGQLYGQHYQYSAPYYQPPVHTNAAYASSQPPSSQVEVPASAAAEKPPLSVDAAKANSNGNATGNNSSAPLRTGHQSSSLNSSASYNRGTLPNGLASSGYQDYGFDGARSPIPWYDGSMFSAGQYRPSTAGSLSSTISYNSITPSARNQNNRPISNLMGLHNPRATAGMGPAAPGYLNRMYPNNRMYGQYGNTLRSGLGFGTTGFDSRTSGRWGLMVDSKFKPRGRGNGFFGYGNENLDGFGELNRGPRAGRFKNPKAIGPTVTIAVKGQNLASTGKEDSTAATPDKEQYNRPDFPENYSDAKFFIIKSYSEDDIHKSIKYSVWASTPNGNRKLDAGYKEAQEKAGGCPVFLFFSVNTSGQFVGVAEMVSPVDFDKSVDYWQQDKWTGCFSVKWHIVKDVPNNILKHIILENNDNKPVTNSRDTQEVKLEQGLQMIKLFKEHVSKTSILDDFAFYENRQKMMQEKKAKQQQTQKQASNVKTIDAIGDEKEKNGANVKLQPQTSLEPISILNRETAAKVGKEVNRETVAQVGNGVNRETAAQIGNGESQETDAKVGNGESKETAAQAGNGENIPSEENVSDPSKAGNGAGNSC